MKLGVLSVLFQDLPLKEALQKIKGVGAEMVEIGCGGYPGKAHCNPEVLLNNKEALAAFKETVAESGLQISAFSTHCNPLHPNKEIAAQAHSDLRNAVLMAECMGVPVVNTFSGCPGGSAEDKTPNWATCPWPEDFLDVLKYQWEEKLIPYWREMGAFAKAHNVKFAFELHPGFCVYNVDSMLRIRKEVGDAVGANLDPSHLVWQGVDPAAAILALKGAIYHFHAKDTRIDARNTAVTGCLDTKHYSDVFNRSWVFCTVGYGMNAEMWKRMIVSMRLAGYDYAVSIEHEDALMSSEEGLAKGAAFLNEIIVKEEAGQMFWA